MINLTLRWTLPTSIISMFLITKWWYALPVDGPDKLYWGFPFPFMGEGFHTSMSFQFFILEFIADFIIHFLCWVVLIYFITKAIQATSPGKHILRIIWALAILLVIGFSILIGISNPIFRLKRDYEWKLLKTGYVFIWQNTPRPEITDFEQQ